ncbi:unnamed protein product [Meganyctiphanes norvegica]|uniref:Uncharacterized protein n=1 Tax=Meganyctiphanes norvegica TaxID=48144 RepID=A0AAV2PNN2_MEGNR
MVPGGLPCRWLSAFVTVCLLYGWFYTTMVSLEFAQPTSLLKPSADQHPNAALTRSCYTYAHNRAHNHCCTMHNYTQEDLHSCARFMSSNSSMPESVRQPGEHPSQDRLYWAIVGDSRLRQILTSTVVLLNGTNLKCNIRGVWKDIQECLPKLIQEKIHEDIIVISEDAPITITFFWDPHLKRLPNLVETWLRQNEAAPQFLLTSTGLHYMVRTSRIYTHYGPWEASRGFAYNLEVVGPALTRLAPHTRVAVQMVDHVLDPAKVQIIKTDFNIDYYNDIYKSWIPRVPNISLWDNTGPLADLYNKGCYPKKSGHITEKESSSSLGQRSTVDHQWWCSDPTHIGYIMINQYTNMLLNHYCNQHMQFPDEYCK